ncbi:hypothetical protein L3X38_038983 [Prunus dulcis]|uniref:Uncharacterized protein n=1 Tax=Prunus dulcis TaxID=3755 RepID=A0AAD4V637_PRUDU|nr:hypothetical protein L3X38_038983 [Prunus dulcis]
MQISAIFQRCENPIADVDDCHKPETYMKAYEPVIHSIPSIDKWSHCGLPPIKPPLYRQQPGRLKRVRIVMIEHPPQPMLSIFAVISFPGAPANNEPLLTHPPKLSTVSLLAPPLNLLGSNPFFRELGIMPSSTPAIYCDNIGATFYCANPVLHSGMKHIDIDFHFVRHLVTRGLLQVSHVSTTDQLTDVLTKPMSRHRFQLLWSKIGVVDGATILQGRIREPQQSMQINASSPAILPLPNKALLVAPSSTPQNQSKASLPNLSLY